MKFNGRPLEAQHHQPYALPRPDGSQLVLRLTPLPLGFHNKLRTHGITLPSPPVRIARDSDGKPLRDELGMAVMRCDEQNEDYRIALELYHQRVAVLIVAAALHDDPQVEFDTARPRDEDWTSYADELYHELQHSGFSAGDLILLCEQVSRISNLTGEHVRSASADFSQRGATLATP